ncbi:MAG: flagellin lysine-N-methylase [Clostridia bacterium]|nr:flagellin lysine-N-methylase [Clostridia bacterium]
MKTYIPDYYNEFRCIAGKCRHSCCIGWEIDIDDASLRRFREDPLVSPYIDIDGSGNARMKLTEDERCPLLRSDGLCELIIRRGEKSLCDICRDHPRYRGFFTDRIELGLGLVCEEAARIILSRPHPIKLIQANDDGIGTDCPEDEAWLLGERERLLAEVSESGPIARFHEYLIFRHIPDALYDGLYEERVRFIEETVDAIKKAYSASDGSISALAETVRAWSYDAEYDDEYIPARLNELHNSLNK